MLQKYLTVLILFFAISMNGQGDTAFFNAIKNNDMATVSNYLQNHIDFCIFDNQEFLSKQVATEKLNQFLANQKVQSVEVIHQGASKGKTSQFKVAKVTTAKGTYRLFVYTSSDFGHQSVKELRIDKF